MADSERLLAGGRKARATVTRRRRPLTVMTGLQRVEERTRGDTHTRKSERRVAEESERGSWRVWRQVFDVCCVWTSCEVDWLAANRCRKRARLTDPTAAAATPRDD